MDWLKKVFGSKGNADTAKQAADILAKESGDPAYIHQVNWNIALKKNDFKTALLELNKALEIVPNDPYYLSLRGMTHYKLGDYANANADLRAALKRNPSQKEAVDFLAAMKKEAMEHRERASKLSRSETVSELNKAIELDPDNPKYLAFRGLTLAQLGEHQRAIKDLKRALELDPQYTDAQKMLDAVMDMARKGGR